MNATERKKLRKIANAFVSGLLAGRKNRLGMCFLTSYALSGYLNYHGYKNNIIKGYVELNGEKYEHYWILLEENDILDATSSQFKKPSGQAMPNIYIGLKPDWYKDVKEKKSCRS